MDYKEIKVWQNDSLCYIAGCRMLRFQLYSGKTGKIICQIGICNSGKKSRKARKNPPAQIEKITKNHDPLKSLSELIGCC